MGRDPVTFRLPPASRFVGLLEYTVVFPVLAFVIFAFMGAVSFALVQDAQLPETAVFGAAAALYLLFLVWLFRFAVDDYRRRAGVEVTIHSDCLTIDRLRENVRVA